MITEIYYVTTHPSQTLFFWDENVAKWFLGKAEETNQSSPFCLSLVSDSPIQSGGVFSPVSFFLHRFVGSTPRPLDEQDREEYLDLFFPQGLPKFRVVPIPTHNEKYKVNEVYVGGQLMHSVFLKTEKSGEALETLLNSFRPS